MKMLNTLFKTCLPIHLRSGEQINTQVKHAGWHNTYVWIHKLYCLRNRAMIAYRYYQ